MVRIVLGILVVCLYFSRILNGMVGILLFVSAGVIIVTGIFRISLIAYLVYDKLKILNRE
jgi:hypothetical protein